MKARQFFALTTAAVLVGGGGFLLGRLGDGPSAVDLGGQQSPAPAAEKTLYTCGMDPMVIQDHPGNCPMCGMRLTPLRRAADAAPGDPATAAPRAIHIDPVTVQNMAIRTATVGSGPLRRRVRTVGTVEYDETALADVTTKFDGWVEKLYVNATGARVHRGDPLFEVYSPGLYSAQTEFLLALETAGADPGVVSLRESARTKLEYWDVSAAQIAELESTRRPRKTLSVPAPIDGFVVEKSVVEGQMASAGTRLYRLADLGLVWVHAEIYEQDLPFVRLGQEAVVSLSYLPDRKFRGRVTYVYPDLDPGTRTARIRMEFHNPGYFLKPGMFAEVELTAELAAAAVLVPEMAVLRSGRGNLVFVAREGGHFEPRAVSLGVRGEEDMLQVLSGLAAGEAVVVSGQFMLDSESQRREAIEKMLQPGSTQAMFQAPAAGVLAAPDGPASGKAGQAESMPPVYLCPMPEHTAIEYDHPGDCPLCGMTLVPVSADLLRQMPPGGIVEHYTCPMPEHHDVQADAPGQCPRCRMTLIPVMRDPLPTRAAPASQTEAPVRPTLYTCPMASHAHIVSDQPGECPDCDMVLVETSTVKHGPESEARWRERRVAGAVDPIEIR
ncbi:MAG: efflux RND transporter periplasmic adaptor subunit [Verrucomicrobiales bacterium]|nr:efflux RND transporter periplasmic adaptor subunit [Verrucomicrobiales bacterium]